MEKGSIVEMRNIVKIYPVVGVGFLLSDALFTVAQEFPDKNFAGIDTYT